MFHERTRDAAKGKWRGILGELGIPTQHLTGKHGPCPVCGGTDRFRFDNKGGAGTWICSHCGAGDGMQLAERVLGLTFREAAMRVDAILGNHKIGTDHAKPELSAEETKALLRRVVASTQRAAPGDLVDAYLRTRNLDEPSYPKAIRFARALNDGLGGVRPAMVAVVQDADGANVGLHRTYLRPDGSGQAEMEKPKKSLGELPDGCAVRLTHYIGGPLGIAEGIETAMAASNLYDMPVWAALNANRLAAWAPPEGCEEVAIFGDHDASFTGQAAAFALARRLHAKGVAVTVCIPDAAGRDWADVWLETCRRPTSPDASTLAAE